MRYQWFWGLLLYCFAALAWGRFPENPWILVDTKALRLQVLEGKRVVATFDGIAIGRGGTTYEKRRGDNKTPLGVFRIGWINEKSKYHRFFGLNYPSLPYVKRGWRRGWIDAPTFRSLLRANFEEMVPPQDTPLGGYIGIHGLGRADPRIHRRYNWTRGCIALTNEQIDRLSRWIRVGTVVVIH